MPAGRAWCHPLLLTRERVLDREVPIGTGPVEEPPGADGQEVLERTRVSRSSALDQVAAGSVRRRLGWPSPGWAPRPSVTAPIASATSLEQLGDLIEATRLELDGPAIELLNQASVCQGDTMPRRKGLRSHDEPCVGPSPSWSGSRPKAVGSAGIWNTILRTDSASFGQEIP